MNAARANKRQETEQLIKDNKDLLSLAQSIQAGMPKGQGLPLTPTRCMMIGLRLADIVAHAIQTAAKPTAGIYNSARKQVMEELHCHRSTVDQTWEELGKALGRGEDLGLQ